MSQNHHAQSKYNKSETWSAMVVYSMKGTVSLGEKMNSEIYVWFPLVNYLGKSVHDLRIEANYTSLPEPMHRHSSGILKIQITWKLHFLCKNWKTLFEQKLIIFRDEINLVSRNISRICKACLESWGQYSRL